MNRELDAGAEEASANTLGNDGEYAGLHPDRAESIGSETRWPAGDKSPGEQPSSPPKAEKPSDTAAPASSSRSRRHKPTVKESGATLSRASVRLPIEAWRMLPDVQQRAHRARKCGGKDSCIACELVYVLRVSQVRGAAIANYTMRECYRLDGDIFDAANTAGKKVDGWATTGKYASAAYRKAVQLEPALDRGITATITKQVTQKWTKKKAATQTTERFDVLYKNEHRPAWWNWEAFKIPLAHATYNLSRLKQRDTVQLAFSLTATSHRIHDRSRATKEYLLPIQCRSSHQYKLLTELADEPKKKGQLTFEYDTRYRKWYARIAYNIVKPPPIPGKPRYVAINRGIVCMLAVVFDDGQRWIWDGADVEAHLRNTQNQRKRYQRQYWASGRKGHGRKRALGPTEYIREKSRKFRKARIDKVARRFVTLVLKRGYTHILIDDLKGIRRGRIEKLIGGKLVWDRIQTWPFDQLLSRIVALAEENGLVVEEREVYFASRDCPKCVHRHEDPVVRPIFECENCGYRRHLDVVLGLNLIHRKTGEAPTQKATPRKDTRKKSRKKAKRTPKSKQNSATPEGDA